ncbi:putative Exo-beta-1,3-glucanae [Truncatella angustata]|uniref:Exo-beta-1,3-glucanae n=1 Tax=Truncatella angustata TaxID=152316 RepID=A0A9P8UK35_9PEZI|nr:putative Exo-beta-1,3-glucanae [Truncatella angustata]KAH6653965.1 putative Exo-beta-1,3-glucanae [Truncatella angustata]
MHIQSFISISCFAWAIVAHDVPRGLEERPTYTVTVQLSQCTTGLTTTSTSTTTATVRTTVYSSRPTSLAAPLASACAYWLENVKHRGIASFNEDAGNYTVFRNVKDYGARGDGVTDDTKAINLAISDGNRCAPGTCASSTTTPALVYFPPGTYIVSGAIVGYYYTQIIGNPNCLPVIKASSDFDDAWVIDGNQYGANGLGWGATNVFWRQIRNFVIDMTDIPATKSVYGIHWAVSQACSLQNIVFQMSSAPGTQHVGLFIEEGSGGFVTDLVFHGGLYGLYVGNQQYTMRNLTFYNAVTAIRQIWDWGWTYSGLSINNCQIGLNLTSLRVDKSQDVGSVVLYDSEIINTPIGIWTARNAGSTPASGGSLILENVALDNVNVAIQGINKEVILAGSTRSSKIAAWGQGHAYTATKGPLAFQTAINANRRPSNLTTGTRYYTRSKPQYEHLPMSRIISIRAAGATGDGKTDDTNAINGALQYAAKSGKVVFFDAGYYKVTRTVFVPAGSKITGEAYPVILSSGSFFADINNPKPVVQVGKSGDNGTVEWSDAIVSTQGAQAGAILIEWNLASNQKFPSGMWDVHTRIGGFAGSKLQAAQCPKTPTTTVTQANLDKDCIGAFQSVHVTKSAVSLYMENCWFWVADHDVDNPLLSQITVYAGRGLLVESINGNIWLVGTSVEHHVLYEYQLSQTKNIVMGQIQTETAYYQPNPDATIPFPTVAALNDPILSKGQNGWGLRIVSSSDVFVYGAGLYSFFANYNVSCAQQDVEDKCQSRIASIENSHVSVYNLNTVGATSMATVNGRDLANWADNKNNFVSTIAWLAT